MNKHQIEGFISTPIRKKFTVPLSLIGAILLWQILTVVGNFPAFILPSPTDVFTRMVQLIGDGSLLYHSMITLGEVISGLVIGLVAAVVLGYLLAKNRVMEKVLSPYIVASQAIPIVAIAPLLVIWFGPGILSKVLITALIVFFPILVNIIVGVRAVTDQYYELMRSLQATKWQTLRFLEIPAAMPVFLGGLRIGATLAVIGAVVGEFVGADRGLGFLVNLGRGLYDTALVFVSIITLVIMALVIYGGVSLLDRWFLTWMQPREFS
jgi:NitT/TauT family transport system permease protein